MTERFTERVVDAGDDAHLEAAWTLKERIHSEEGVLAQRREFFVNQYRRSRDYLVFGDGSDELAGFAVVRADGYLSMLGVAPDYRRKGVGTRLITRMAGDYDRITCHTRVTNQRAVAFYTDLGFTVEKRVEYYYRNGDDAYLLALDDGGADLLDRLTDAL